jgi:PAS domain S-box-containing protein
LRFPDFISLRLRVMLLILLSVFPALILIAYLASEERGSAMEGAQESAQKLIERAAARFDRTVDEAQQTLTVLAQLPEVQACDPASSRVFSRILARSPGYANVGAVTPDGRHCASAVPFSPDVPVTDLAWYQRAVRTRRFAVGDFQIGHLTHLPSVNVAQPMLDRSGRLTSIVYLAIKLSWLGSLAEQANLPAGSRLWFVDSHGRVLARYPDSKVEPGRSMQAVPVFRSILARRAGLAEASGSDGQPRVYVYSPLSAVEPRGMDPLLVVSVPRAAIYAESDRLLATHLVLLGGTALVVLLLAWFGSDWFLLRTINHLLAVTRRFGTGDLSARTGLSSQRDELGRLARGFDEMADSLQALTRRNQLILGSVAEGILGMDAQGSITFANPAAARMVGYSPDELIGQNGHDLLHRYPHGEPMPEEHCAIRRTLADGQVRRVVHESFRRRDGSAVPIEYVVAPLEEGGSILGGVIAFADLTDRLAAERERAELAGREQRAQAELEATREVQRLKEQFVSAVSHDLRTPLTSIKGYAEFLEDGLGGPLTPGQADYVREIERNVGRLELLLDDLLDYARLEAGTFRLNCEEGDLPQRVRAIAHSLRPLAEAARIRMETNLPEASRPVRMDPTRIEQVLANLIGNAIKFTPAGGRIEVTVRTLDDALLCEVSDTGPGIAAEDLPKLFRRFSQLPSGAAKVGGTGLGLSICKAIVEAHGGRIGVRSQVGVGSTFWFTLPLEPVVAKTTA